MDEQKLTLKIHLKEGTIIDVTEAVTSITWSGDIKSPSRTLAFNVVQAINDKEIEAIGVTEGDTVSFFENDIEIFRGILIDVDKKSDSNEVIYTAKDIGFLLSKNKLSFNFKNKTAEDVAKEVIKKLGYKIGVLAKTGYKYNKIVTNSSGYEIIQAAYTERAGVTKKKYMTYAHKDMYYVIEKGEKVLELQFNEKENLLSTSYKISLENMVNKVLVTDSNGNKISEEVDNETLKLYKITIQEIKNQTDKNSTSGEVSLKKPEKTASLVGYGDTKCKCGNAVYVKDSATGLIGKFYIDTDKHTWKGGDYQIELGLNFENIMDEKEISDPGEEDTSTASGGVLNGKKVKAKFTAYYPSNSSMEGGYYAANGEKLNPSSNTCAAPKSIAFNTQIQVLGTGTKYDSKTFRVNDRGGAINWDGDRCDIDLLMKNASEANNFGVKYGEVIIGDGTGYSSGSGNSKAVSLAKSKLGKPYKWGATGPNSFDCSGLIYWVAKQMGKTIPRTSSQQSKYGTSVSKSALQPGDCVFFGSPVHHVGMYVGNNQYIHAPQTGDVVKISSLSSRKDYAGARRFL